VEPQLLTASGTKKPLINKIMEKVYTHLVDDDEYTIESITKMFDENGISYLPFRYPEEFRENKEKKRVCIIDYRFNNSGITGVELAEEIIEENTNCQVIMITGYLTNTPVLKLMNVKSFKNLDKNDPEFMQDLLKYVKRAIKIAEKIVEMESLKLNRNGC
jgi:FixJ family two-component response regulator